MISSVSSTSGSLYLPGEYDLDAHIPEKSPDVSSSVLDPGERELGDLGPRRGQWTKRNTFIEPTAHEGPPPAKPSSTPKLRSAKGMCTPKVPGRYYNPRRRSCHACLSPSSHWSTRGAHDGSYSFCSAAPLPWSPAVLSQWSWFKSHSPSLFQPPSPSGLTWPTPVTPPPLPLLVVPARCWSLPVWLGFLPKPL